MNLLILGDRKPLNDSDDALACLAGLGGSVTFLYRGPAFAQPFGVALDEADPLGQIRSLVRERRIDAIYLRVDWFDKLYTTHGPAILAADLGVPLVLGYHCHTCHRTPLEEQALRRADALVLLNVEAQSWFESRYGIDKPTLLVPSLFLPARAWYAHVPLRAKLSAKDGQKHVVIPSAVIRRASVPTTLDPNVPVENYVLDRYDYFTLCEQLARRGIAVHVYGKFAVQGGPAASTAAASVEATYRALARRYPNLIHFPGRVDQAAFAAELSQYDAALLTGFVPYQPVPRFDHMNYQLRFNPVLAAGLPSFIPAGTTSCGEREIRDGGAGFVFDSFGQMVHQLYNAGAMADAAAATVDARERHCAEAWAGPMGAFFADTARRYRNHSSLRAA